MSKIVGIDVGTNSLGITVRDDSRPFNEQIIYSTVHLFKSGVVMGKKREFSLATQRTEKRGARHLYKVRRYRKWATLRMLIRHNCCPLTEEDLQRWTHYDKAQGVRVYPTDIEPFNNWIKLDFDGDGKPDYTNPYELRSYLATVPDLDFTNPMNRYKLGRAIYHIAERRGFRSSKGEKAGESDSNEDTPKKSELARSSELASFRPDLPTVGCKMYEISKTQRIRASKYTVIRQQYKDEIAYIFNFQRQLGDEKEFLDEVLSEKKSDGSVFYKQPLKSQKGNVGHCTLEPSKTRCSQSRPEFEMFTAWSFINNIRYGKGCQQELTLEQKNDLYEQKFIRATDFQFESIRTWIEKTIGVHCSYSRNTEERSINYPDDTKVEACTVTYHLRRLLGQDWQNWSCSPNKQHTTGTDRDSIHPVTYSWEDVWHVCFTADDEEPLARFADDAQLDFRALCSLFYAMSLSYASLSLKAIRNINRFLLLGMLYNDACLFAKLPDILGDRWENDFIPQIQDVLRQSRAEKAIIHTVNNLIANHKIAEHPWALHDTGYQLQQSDLDDVQTFAITELGDATWNQMQTVDQESFLVRVAELYQQYFASHDRKFYRVPSTQDVLKSYLVQVFADIPAEKFNRLYHHSKINVYPPAREHSIRTDNCILSKKLLDSPAISSLRNPMALRVLYTLRHDINKLLISDIIDEEDTRIVVEVARELNDANMRWAITQYDKRRRDENAFFASLLGEFTQTDEAITRVRLLAEQSPELLSHTEENEVRMYKDYMDQLMTRYKLWREQKGICLYTGKTISITSVLSGNEVDIEHTLPRSQSFDDSLSNKTLCISFSNRHIKGNRLPSQLDNYQDIMLRIQPWIDKVDRLKRNISFWRYRAKKTQDKNSKDMAICQRHLWELEYEYWSRKVDNFRAKEIRQSFRNNQLNDTSTIARYATLYLKSLFSSVDVERGAVTAVFRELMNLPKKSRDNNSHHAVDALVLTYVPRSAQREKLMNLYYLQKEAIEQGHDDSHIVYQINREKRLCGLDIDINPNIQFLRQTVISRYSSHEQVLTPASRRLRKAGRIVPRLDDQGNKVYEYNPDGSLRSNRYGNPIPQARYWSRGDSIRGQLFGDNFYGKIMLNGQETVVIRRGGGFVKFEEKHIPYIVDPCIRAAIEAQVSEKGFEQARKDGFFIVGPSGVKTPIRHVRCSFNEKPVIPVKKQAYLSTKEHKQYAYSTNGEFVLYAMYTNGKDQDKRCVTLREAAIANKGQALSRLEDLLPDTVISKSGKVLNRAFVLNRGDMLILKKKDENLPLSALDQREISNRLYRFCAMEKASLGLIKLQHHLFSASDCKAKAVKTYTVGDSQPLLLVALSKQEFWVEGKDFKIELGKFKVIE